ncbi:C39 family peptidase [Solibacillus sp. CAU 1738]|uniref:C39 family peptidase n=1 Tax=Solibacillus sp. CAU 1738 TaxID=3140363 RepID=UPI0032607E41
MKQLKHSYMLTLPLCIALLVGCQNNQLALRAVSNHEIANFSDDLTVYAVEYYSRTAIQNIEIAIENFETKEEIGSAFASSDGAAIFDMLIENEAYEAVIYRVENGIRTEQSRQAFVFDKSKPHVFVETFYPHAEGGLAVPIVLQNPELPNGCEITSLTAMLNYFGIVVDKMTMKRDYLPREKTEIRDGKRYGPDPEIAYAGNPASATDGFYVFAEPIAIAANQILFENNSKLAAQNKTGATRNELINLVNEGYPVLTWVTIDWQNPRTNSFWLVETTGERHPIYSNLHAVVLTGVEGNNVTIMNPLTGYETIDINTFFDSYESLGSHAVVIK